MSKARPTERRNSLAGRQRSKLSSKCPSAITALRRTRCTSHRGMATGASARRYIYTQSSALVHTMTQCAAQAAANLAKRNHALFSQRHSRACIIHDPVDNSCYGDASNPKRVCIPLPLLSFRYEVRTETHEMSRWQKVGSG